MINGNETFFAGSKFIFNVQSAYTMFAHKKKLLVFQKTEN